MPGVIDIFDAQDVAQGAQHGGKCMLHQTTDREISYHTIKTMTQRIFRMMSTQRLTKRTL